MRRSLFVAVSLSAAAFGVSAASTFEPLAFREVVARADLAFQGKVTAIAEEASPNGRMALTHVTFHVDAVIADPKDSVKDGAVTVTFAGGTSGDTRIVVAGVPTFVVGDEAVLFLHHDGRVYANPCVGGERGLFRVLRDAKTNDSIPLAAGSRGIVAIEKDEPQLADIVLGLEDGAIRWRDRPVDASPPAPATTTVGGAARRSVDVAPPRPTTLLSLSAFVASARALRK